MQDRSGQIRVAMWGEATEFLIAHPITGAGLASYAAKITPYHTLVNGEKIEIFSLPHNLFLSIYVNLGLLGLISFILIIYCYFKILISNFQFPISNKFSISQFPNFSIYLSASMLTLLVMGLVDTPYIKNDLAIFFWLLPALSIIIDQEKKSA
jgi:O-antigen ligase